MLFQGQSHGFNVCETGSYFNNHWIDYGKSPSLCACNSFLRSVPMEALIREYQGEAEYLRYISPEHGYDALGKSCSIC